MSDGPAVTRDGAGGPLPLSVFIIAQNEADRIGRTIEAVRDLSDDILVIDSGSTDGTQAGFSLHLTTEPAPGDQVVQGAEHPVFVDAAVVDELDDKVLDAQIEGDQVGFMLAQAS